MTYKSRSARDAKLWVDDIRNPPTPVGYDIARTYDEAIMLMTKCDYDVVFLDHDLGDFTAGKERTGYDVLMWIVEQKQAGQPVPTQYILLTANPIGRDRMAGVIERYLIGEDTE